MEFQEMKTKLEGMLETKRFVHTMGVVSTASQLASCYGVDTQKAEIAALLHDCAKNIPYKQRFELCEESKVPISEAEHNNPTLLHAKCGAILAKTEFGIRDPEILHAIAVHTTGCPEMGMLDKIIFVSDYIEPERGTDSGLQKLREIACKNLDLTVYLILGSTLKFLKERGQELDITTADAYNYYAELMKKPIEKDPCDVDFESKETNY